MQSEAPDHQDPKKETYREKQQRWLGVQSPPPLKRRYSISRVKKIYREVYGIEVINITPYKGNRNVAFPYEMYKMVETATGRTIVERAPLFAMAEAIQEDYDNPDY